MGLGLFDDGTGIIPLGPHDILGACTERLDHRYSGVDVTVQRNLLNDHQTENRHFQDLINKQRMNSWYEMTLETARADFKADMNQITSDGSDMGAGKDALEQAEKRIAEKEQRKANGSLKNKSLHSRSIGNGHTRSIRASIMQH